MVSNCMLNVQIVNGRNLTWRPYKLGGVIKILGRRATSVPVTEFLGSFKNPKRFLIASCDVFCQAYLNCSKSVTFWFTHMWRDNRSHIDSINRRSGDFAGQGKVNNCTKVIKRYVSHMGADFFVEERP
ncbi:hypothetical protein CEXT_753661 [Caerostris extrusa]|uniref:PiggyBac transposable element-derived protein domain-containing protein n=1 Tax=Caerostris extrusa TaxID=172846 RepID=A0AAV4NLY8_CAEEX|nr:hypothetical protein CEXT_753661 [Caerostris extrusa]